MRWVFLFAAWLQTKASALMRQHCLVALIRPLLAIFLLVGSAHAQSGPNGGIAGPPGVSGVGTTPFLATGGTTARTNAARAVDNWIEAPDAGVDCTDTNDVGSALQTVINGFAAAGQGEVRFPIGCTMKLGTGLGDFLISSASYSGTTITLTMATNPGLSVGSWFVVTGITGMSGQVNGIQQAIAGTSGTNVEYTVAASQTGSPSAGTVQNCGVTIAKQTNVQLVSEIESWGTTVGNNPTFKWVGSGGIAFCVYSTYHPTFRGFAITLANNSYTLDGCIDFDGDVGPTGTAGVVEWVTCSLGGQKNLNFVGISIAATTTQNQENYFLDHNNIVCSGVNTIHRAADGVTNGTTTLTSATANFVSGDVGSRIRVSYAGGLLDTTVASVTNSTTAILTTGASFSQSGVTIHTGQSYGIGILNGSAQARNQIFNNEDIQLCSTQIYINGGSFEISHLSGGYSDIGIYVGSSGDFSDVYFDTSESDLQGFVAGSNPGNISLRNSRWDITNALANGFFHYNSNPRLTFLSNGGFYELPTNAVLFGFTGNTPAIFSAGNDFGGHLTITQINYLTTSNLLAWCDAGILNSGAACASYAVNLPTSSSGLAAGQIYNNSGVLTINP